MRPPVDLNAEIVLPSGQRIRWDAASPDAGNRPLSPSFETESGRGFSSGSVVLRRPTGRDYPELGLLNELILRSATGTVVYQGRAQGIPVSEEFSLDCDGWYSALETREVTDLIVDREVSAWGSITNVRKAVQGPSIGTTLYDTDYTADTERGVIVITGSTGQSIPNNSAVEVAYRAPYGSTISRLEYAGTQTNTTNVAAPTVLSSDETMVTTQSSNLTLDGLSRSVDFSNRPRTLIVGARSSIAHTPSAQFVRRITPTVFGQTGVPISNRTDGLRGFTAAEGIRYILRKWAPKLNASGVQDSEYLIPQGVWRDPTTPGDMIRQMNAYHLWKLGVWEDRRLDFAPYDLSVADWQVQAGVDGVRVDYQGDTTENVFNGVAVSFTGFDGEPYRLTPDDSADLRDSSEWIAANQWGDEVWLNIDVSWPCSDDDAVEIGRVALANANQARRPSTITVPAYIQDIHGTYWPSSYVRADQTIVVTNQHTPIPRLITRTSWSDHSLTITTDDAIDTMQALNQRISGALSARGLG